MFVVARRRCSSDGSGRGFGLDLIVIRCSTTTQHVRNAVTNDTTRKGCCEGVMKRAEADEFQESSVATARLFYFPFAVNFHHKRRLVFRSRKGQACMVPFVFCIRQCDRDRFTRISMFMLETMSNSLVLPRAYQYVLHCIVCERAHMHAHKISESLSAVFDLALSVDSQYYF